MPIKKILSLFSIMILLACSDRKAFLLGEYQKSFADVIGNKIDFGDFDITSDSEYKILVLLNTQCASCPLTVKRWSQSMNSEAFQNKDIIFLSYGQPNEYFDSNFQESTATIDDLNHLHDESGQFLYSNNLESYSLDVFLLNGENEILLIGDPTKDSLVEKFYQSF